MGNQRNSGRNRRQHQQAWAPYNFVPLPDRPLNADLADGNIPHRHDYYATDRHTGYFDVTLTTETPLFVRGMLTVGEQEAGIEIRHKPDPFSLDGKFPVIPGSSLRGMIRTLVEIVTNSKMHFVSDADQMFFRAVAADKTDPLKEPYQRTIGSFGKNVRAGYLVRDKGHWYVQPAKRMGQAAYGKIKDRNSDGSSPVAEVRGLIRFNNPSYMVQYHDICYEAEGDRVYRAYTPSKGKQPMGVLVCTGNMAETQQGNRRVESPRRRYAVVAEPDHNARPILIPDKVIQDYIEGRSAFQKEEPFDKNYGVLLEDRPVFYIEDSGQVVHFGHTPNFRIAPLVTDQLTFDRRAVTPRDLIPNEVRQQNPALDYAEALFGYVSEKDENRVPSAYAGRVSVTSAFVTEERDSYFDRTIVPKILASPKPTTFQHYLEQPEGWRTPTHQLRHYGDDTRIRGYKLYWRQMTQNLADIEESQENITPNDTQHTRIRPVRSGTQFGFRLYFENLSDVELGALIWVLTLGGDPQARHQLGMGKPFGLGVVKLEPRLVLTPRQDRYSLLFDDSGNWYTAETQVGQASQAELVNAFKSEVGNFDNQRRIRELRALLRIQDASNHRFSYMQIEPPNNRENDYQGRPVLPYPTEIGD